MLHLLYILAFTILAFLAVGNLIRSLISLSADSQRPYSSMTKMPKSRVSQDRDRILHPELLDDAGNVISEPLLVMKSITVEDARAQLDALYKSSPNSPNDIREES
ncbi:MAG: DUF2973 domain-containing protein [Oscillatoriaceae bacterium SKW80]|nr:DUF2973 domain-containing protein [Oscillatoriaceae bacterium SKYG93]MCX8122106.1 DUF2973 domain-containing protein [Oscillatoriaceae bacterium SKW80]MDW8454393.1 DUF2973 domain-containing protein [Oscillatoriaceae cyanobacterium SKYGB_i_bin93]HIK29256.1 DUF2973 domain-containing protein [Oscillatoriaceae cyanobacterium M7585_C2015_266]